MRDVARNTKMAHQVLLRLGHDRLEGLADAVRPAQYAQAAADALEAAFRPAEQLRRFLQHSWQLRVCRGNDAGVLGSLFREENAPP